MMQTMLHAAEKTSELAADASSELTLADRLSMAGTTTLMGMVAVFAVLTIIMLIVMIMGKIVGGSAKKSKIEKEELPAPPVPTPADDALDVPADDEEELAAAITAAIAAYRAAEEQYTGGFRVVSFRKANTKPSWNKQ